MGVFQIPGNIKQEILPFVLNPEADINKPVDGGSTNLRGVPPQYFTYKTNTVDLKAGKGKLRLFPASYNNLNLKDDLSYQMLYKRDPSGKIDTGSITLSDILNSVPGVQIREYLPDTRLDQCLNFFINLFDKIKDIFGGSKNASSSGGESGKNTPVAEANNAGFFDKLVGTAQFAMKYLLGSVSPNLVENLDKRWEVFKSQFGAFGNDEFLKKHGKYVLRFPYMLYYNLQSCVTTNIYEIPAIQQSKRIASSEGMPGWTGGSSTGMRLTSLLNTNSLPGIGKLINGILGNVAVDYLPWWNAESGSATKEPEVTIEFDLFNDSAEAAMTNFIFVNTIVPHNKWIQYHFFQHSSSLYDIKIEGVNRLFACAGTFEVTYQGVLRDPPVAWLQTLCNKHANVNSVDKGKLLGSLLNDKIIKIPDIYHVSLKFQSLLPANFNNFIFTYSSNNNIVNQKDKFGFYEGEATKGFEGAITDFGKALADVWNAGGNYSSAGYKDVEDEPKESKS